MKAREVGARAIRRMVDEITHGSDFISHSDYEPCLIESDCMEADAILAAFAREGLAVVPVEPTQDMIDAGMQVVDWPEQNCDGTWSWPTGPSVYRAMLAAAKKETDHDE